MNTNKKKGKMQDTEYREREHKKETKTRQHRHANVSLHTTKLGMRKKKQCIIKYIEIRHHDTTQHF